MPQLDKRLQDILGKYHDSPRDAVWDCHGTWVAYHKDLEIIAARAGIKFEMPVLLEADGQKKCAALCVAGNMDDRHEWSIGEASPNNNKNAYPFAMAEKRAKDRVILKLLGLSGFIYSEEEADDFKPTGAKERKAKGQQVQTELQSNLKDFAEQLGGIATTPDLEDLMTTFHATIEEAKLNAAAWWETGEGLPEEFVPLHDRIVAVQERLAIQGL